MRLRLDVAVLADGGLELSSPHLEGWNATARGPWQVWQALRGAAALFAVSPPTGSEPAPDGHRLPRSVRSYSKYAIVRPDQASPAAWQPLPPLADGTRPWRSPKGRTYCDPTIVNAVIAKRALLGLPVTYEEECEARAHAARLLEQDAT